MNSSSLFALLFAMACGTLLLLPFVPAWREWLWPTDAGALPVPEGDDQDPLHFARALRSRMAKMRRIGPSAGYEPINEVDAFEAGDRRLPILAVDPVRTVGAVSSLRPLYAAADLDFRGGASFAEVMSEGRLDLGPDSQVGRWAHAERGMRVGERSVLTRRVTSAETVEIARDCCFERVHAPVVRFGTGPHTAEPQPQERPGRDLGQLPDAVERSPGLWYVDGDCKLPAGSSWTGSLIVTGSLVVGAHARLDGSIKAHRAVVVAEGAEVTGAIVSEESVQLRGGTLVGGPVVGEERILLGARSVVGTRNSPTSVYAAHIVAEEGAVAHGTVWAREAGIVWGVRR